MSNENHPTHLLRGASPLDLDSARQLLEEAGIPSMAHYDNPVRAYFGAGYDHLRGGDLLVPHAALEAAREVLRNSWDTPALTRHGLLPPPAPGES